METPFSGVAEESEDISGVLEGAETNPIEKAVVSKKEAVVTWKAVD